MNTPSSQPSATPPPEVRRLGGTVRISNPGKEKDALKKDFPKGTRYTDESGSPEIVTEFVDRQVYGPDELPAFKREVMRAPNVACTLGINGYSTIGDQEMTDQYIEKSALVLLEVLYGIFRHLGELFPDRELCINVITGGSDMGVDKATHLACLTFNKQIGRQAVRLSAMVPPEYARYTPDASELGPVFLCRDKEAYGQTWGKQPNIIITENGGKQTLTMDIGAAIDTDSELFRPGIDGDGQGIIFVNFENIVPGLQEAAVQKGVDAIALFCGATGGEVAKGETVAQISSEILSKVGYTLTRERVESILARNNKIE